MPRVSSSRYPVGIAEGTSTKNFSPVIAAEKCRDRRGGVDSAADPRYWPCPRAAEKGRELAHGAEVLGLSLVGKFAHPHALDHALANRLMVGVATDMSVLLSRIEASCLGPQLRRQRRRFSHFAHWTKGYRASGLFRCIMATLLFDALSLGARTVAARRMLFRAI